jgi:hypothetical protein
MLYDILYVKIGCLNLQTSFRNFLNWAITFQSFCVCAAKKYNTRTLNFFFFLRTAVVLNPYGAHESISFIAFGFLLN